jgi:hypothetical protein
MNVAVWVLQIVLALAFLLAGVTKVSQPRQKLAASMGWVEDFSDSGVRTIGPRRRHPPAPRRAADDRDQRHPAAPGRGGGLGQVRVLPAVTDQLGRGC